MAAPGVGPDPEPDPVTGLLFLVTVDPELSELLEAVELDELLLDPDPDPESLESDPESLDRDLRRDCRLLGRVT